MEKVLAIDDYNKMIDREECMIDREECMIETKNIKKTLVT